MFIAAHTKITNRKLANLACRYKGKQSPTILKGIVVSLFLLNCDGNATDAEFAISANWDDKGSGACWKSGTIEYRPASRVAVSG